MILAHKKRRNFSLNASKTLQTQNDFIATEIFTSTHEVSTRAWAIATTAAVATAAMANEKSKFRRHFAFLCKKILSSFSSISIDKTFHFRCENMHKQNLQFMKS